MAENEILDVGNPKHCKRWRKALADPNFTFVEIALSLSEDFAEGVMKMPRDKSLNNVLNACGQDHIALLGIFANSKDIAWLKLVVKAFNITHSRNPEIIATKSIQILLDSTLDNARRYILKIKTNYSTNDHLELEYLTAKKLRDRQAELTEKLAASLRGEAVKLERQIKKPKTTIASLLTTSLLPTIQKSSQGQHHV